MYLPGRDFGISVLALTVLVRLLLYPVSKMAIASQKTLSDLEPKRKEIQERWKDDKERQAREILALYKQYKVNPFASVVPLLIQLPILIALFRLLGRGMESIDLNGLYSFVPRPEQLDFQFLDIINLAEPHLFFAILAGVAQFVQTKMLTPRGSQAFSKQKKGQESDFTNIMQKQMLYFFPVLTVFILLRLPSALALYWIATTVLTIFQQYFMLRKSGFPKRIQTI